MNEQEYITKLEAQNGYCACPEISDLLDLRRKVESLENRCEFFDRNLGKDVDASDEKFLQDYENSVESFKETAAQYYSKLTDYANQKKVKIILHDVHRFKPCAEMPAKQAIDFLSRTPRPVMTVHCSECNQQIDLTD